MGADGWAISSHKKKQVYALAGFLVLCDLRSTEL